MANCLLLGSGGGGSSWLFDIPEMHRSIFRGQSLGSSVTAAQQAAIADGSFDDLFLGDYWTIGGVNYRIADMDYLLGAYDFPDHHLVIVPDTSLYTAQMNASNTNSGGYLGSAMHTTNLDNARTAINAAFPGLVLTYSDFLTNGSSSLGAATEVTIELMSEIMLSGCDDISEEGIGVPRLEITQLALFAVAPKFILSGGAIWLRDLANNGRFVGYENVAGDISWNTPSSTLLGVRPFFFIGAAA